MKASLALALAGSLLMAAPVFADDPTPAPSQQSDDDFAARKDAYLKRMNDEMTEMGKKIDAYSAKAKERGERAGKDADKDLRQAWDKTKEESRDVAAATKTGWDKARAAFERTSRKLQDQWREHSAQ